MKGVYTSGIPMQNAFARYQKSNWSTLLDVYSKPNKNKMLTYSAYVDFMMKYDGYNLKIVSYSATAFSVGFIAQHPETLANIFVWITPSKIRWAYLLDLC